MLGRGIQWERGASIACETQCNRGRGDAVAKYKRSGVRMSSGDMERKRDTNSGNRRTLHSDKVLYILKAVKG